MENVIDILKERGFIDAMTGEEVRDLLQAPIKIYSGFDPTAESLHIGHLVPLIGLAWFQRCGHTPVALIGGATGMIGDPSGKSKERVLLDEEAIKRNVAGITKDVETVLSRHSDVAKPLIVNNLDWFGGINFIAFLRDIGKNFRMGTMLAKESVKSRLNSDEGLSFTEFSYQVLQAYDFYHLAENEDIVIQLGGSDQWGNITAGTELIRKIGTKKAAGITFPLLNRSDGKKFGKSEEGTIWLSPEKLQPYDFYQYLVRIHDDDVIKLMKLLTFMDLEEIRRYESSMEDNDYIPNTAQKRLAEEVTRIVHGEEGVTKALRATEAAAPGAKTVLDAKTLESIAADIPSAEADAKDVIGEKVLDIMVQTGFLGSKGEGRRLIRNKGVYVNNVVVEDENTIIEEKHLIEGRMFLIAAGKKRKILITIRGL
ncbi:MAG: tyrosine--tRNA ligase [Waddliaceae bacterium]|nr:tyrosine--tRNA ligase [Waddliaceae bacterium]